MPSFPPSCQADQRHGIEKDRERVKTRVSSQTTLLLGMKGSHLNKQFLKDAVGWGFVLWLIGYALGVMLFAFVAAHLIGWIIMPFGAAIALWVSRSSARAAASSRTVLRGDESLTDGSARLSPDERGRLTGDTARRAQPSDEPNLGDDCATRVHSRPPV